MLWPDESSGILAYDTGPANGPLDAVVQHVLAYARVVLLHFHLLRMEPAVLRRRVVVARSGRRH